MKKSTKQKLSPKAPKKPKLSAEQSRKTLAKVFRYLRHYRPLIFLSVLLAGISVALTLYIPIVIGDAIDLMIGKGQIDFQALYPFLIRAGVSALIIAVCQWLMGTLNNKITFEVIRDTRRDAFEHLQVLPLSYLDTKPTGEIVSRVIADVDQFADGLLLGFTQLFTGVLTILGTLIFMLTLHPAITAVVVVLTPLSLLAARFIASRTYDMFRAQSEVRGEQTALIDEMIGNQKIVKAFSMEKQTAEHFDRVNEKLSDCALRATFYSSLVNPSTRFINAMVYAGVALTGALTVLQPGTAFTVGKLSCFLTYANQYTKPFNEISGVITELQNALACAARIFELIEQPARVPDDPNSVPLTDVRGNVGLENVAFSYVPERPLIRDLNLRVESGQRIAIVGPTGCGKTTLINLLMRFYDVNEGSISVDGVDIRHMTRKNLRQSYGMVLQETWMKSGTIRENITMGKPDATDEEIEAAARASHAHSFIKRLPNGYDTVIGEDGGSLSQGQKQLLCITRVMLCLPPMLILDEATSSIDTRTEIKIQDAFAKLMRGRTSFIVAHRLSTIQDADVILVMKDGNIIEHGKHDELLSAGGFYAKLYNSQFEQS